MKNYEKYADEIKGYDGDSICRDFIEPYILKSINAKCINTSCPKCHLYRTIWLMEEYEEPEIDWSKIKIDTPVLVRDNENNEWRRFHFAKYENGLVYTWVAGATSWTAKGNMYKWRFAKLAESEDKCEKTNKEEPETDWSKVEVDTPILVREYEHENWVRRYFAKYEGGKVYVWNNGRTSWTEKFMTPWKFAKLAESEETK